MKSTISVLICAMQLFCLQLESAISSDEALERLLKGNQRYMKDQGTCVNRNQDRRTASPLARIHLRSF